MDWYLSFNEAILKQNKKKHATDVAPIQGLKTTFFTIFSKLRLIPDQLKASFLFLSSINKVDFTLCSKFLPQLRREKVERIMRAIVFQNRNKKHGDAEQCWRWVHGSTETWGSMRVRICVMRRRLVSEMLPYKQNPYVPYWRWSATKYRYQWQLYSVTYAK